MNWLRSHYSQLRNALIGVICVALVLFVWYGYSLYRDRKAEERMLAAQQEQWQELLNAETESHAHDVLTMSYPDFSDMEEWAKLYNMGPYQKAAWIENEDGTVTYNGRNYKRSSYIKAILCIGVDRSDEMTGTREFGEAGQADGLFLVAQDTAHNELKILIIPRDSMLQYPVKDADGTEYTDLIDHITLAFGYGDGSTESCERTVNAVSDLLCGLRIDHYLAADTAVIALCNDAVDGVTVTVPTEGMEKKDPAFVYGETITLHGKQAEDFVRYRDTTVDQSALYRMNQMREYITQYFEAVKKKSKEDSMIVSHIYDEAQNYIITDMQKADILRMAMDAMNGNDLTDASFVTLPGSGITTDFFDEYYVNYGQAIPVILDLFYREVE